MDLVGDEAVADLSRQRVHRADADADAFGHAAEAGESGAATGAEARAWPR